MKLILTQIYNSNIYFMNLKIKLILINIKIIQNKLQLSYFFEYTGLF